MNSNSMSIRIHELRYTSTNTYLIEGEKGRLLLDTGWAGTFPAFCRACGDLGIPVQSIDCILITHFHPDHMGIAQEIADLGPVIAAMDVQQAYIHAADRVFAKDARNRFVPIDDGRLRIVPIAASRAFLKTLGLDGEILHTPGHSDDSISLILDEGSVFAGDLNPLYELELHKGEIIEKSWNEILKRHPVTVYYGHAGKAELNGSGASDAAYRETVSEEPGDLYRLTERIMKYIDKGVSLEKIRKKTHADPDFIENAARMYLTHQNVGVQGILDRIERRERNGG